MSPVRDTAAGTSADASAAGPVPWLDDAQLHDWRSLMSLVAVLPSALDTQLKRDAGVNAFEYHVLAALSEAPERTLQLSDLAHLSRGSLSRLSHAVTRLERDGWLTRTLCTGDGAGRRVEARLTEAGWAKIRETAPGHVREARRLVVDVLSEAELRTLGAAARKVAKAAGLDLESCDGDATCAGPSC
ncbi:MarR family winged helix-turn-helix transcriptional regulator [Oryzobacter terrae]|uniref:MarR family winged helix-turn-helix transcriptional regulator n=1 Tax=Oryzobacter terrae TaxID=1620385 RepID=UPI00366EF3B4